MTDPNLPIGIFDSGLGGLSVLRTALRMLPDEHFVYYGDIANAPYGTKAEEEVFQCAHRVTRILLDRGIKALVIACNTATCAAAARLRAEYPDLIIIGMEPALKLAHDLCPSGQILVLATPVSLASEKYRRLYENYGDRAVSIPCPGLMEYVERGDVSGASLKRYLQERTAPFLHDGTPPAAVVMGCTHYVFLKKAAQELFPSSRVLDGNEGTVRQLGRRLDESGLLACEPGSLPAYSLCFNTSGHTDSSENVALKLLRMPE